MLRTVDALAGRLLSLVLPETVALAACTPKCYYICNSAGRWRCCRSSTCVESCTRVCLCCLSTCNHTSC